MTAGTRLALLCLLLVGGLTLSAYSFADAPDGGPVAAVVAPPATPAAVPAQLPAVAPSPEVIAKDPGGAAVWLLNHAGKPGPWMPVAAVVLGLAVWFVRREQGWLVAHVPALGSRWGGYAVNAGIALLVWLSAGLAAGHITLAGFVGFLSTAGLAALGWNAVKDALPAPPGK